MAKNVNFGIDDMKVGVWVGATAPVISTFVDIPARGISLDTESESEEWEADNKIIDIRRYNKKVTGSIEIATLSPPLAVIFGNGASATTGSGGNITTTYTEVDSTTTKNFEIAARSYGGDGTVVEVRVLKGTVTAGPNFDLSTGAYSAMTVDYEGFGNAAGELWKLVSMEGTAAVVEIPTA